MGFGNLRRMWEVELTLTHIRLLRFIRTLTANKPPQSNSARALVTCGNWTSLTQETCRLRCFGPETYAG